MTLKNKQIFLISLLIISTIIVSNFGFVNMAFAQEYDFVAGIHTEITFYFRDGAETVNFPVFSTTSDLVDNVGTSFVVEGVIGDNPHLHKALDEAYEHRLARTTGGSAFEYNHRFFDVDVNVVQNGVILKPLKYNNCEISQYGISTLNDDYESYLASNTGFAMVTSIEFNCGGVHFDSEKNRYNSVPEKVFTDYGSLPFTLAEDVRTFLTFEFDNGAEKIESVIFNSMSGFSEGSYDNPSFQIITAVLPHPLIDNAIENSQKVSGLATTFNQDFDVNVDFVNSEEKLRGLNFEGCIIDGYSIVTLRDKEEGYTGKRGFATAEIIDVECSGLIPDNPKFKTISKKNYDSSSITQTSHTYNMGTGPHMIATFDFDAGKEIVDFPEFYQGNLISRGNPTFQLTGVPGVTPLLNDVVDNSRKTGAKITGINPLTELFDVNLSLVYGIETIRSFDYNNCRVIDYVIKTEHDAEESFYNGFALTNEYHFECQGYHPVNSSDLSPKQSKAKSESSIDYKAKQKSSWDPNFRYSKD